MCVCFLRQVSSVFSSLFFFLFRWLRLKTDRKIFFFTFEYLGVTLTTFDASSETVLAITAPHPSRKARRITARLVPGGPLSFFLWSFLDEAGEKERKMEVRRTRKKLFLPPDDEGVGQDEAGRVRAREVGPVEVAPGDRVEARRRRRGGSGGSCFEKKKRSRSRKFHENDCAPVSFFKTSFSVLLLLSLL